MYKNWMQQLCKMPLQYIHDTVSQISTFLTRKMAIANALQLEATRVMQLWCHAMFEVAKPMHCHIIAFLLLIHYSVTLTFGPMTLTFDLEHLQRIACDVMKRCTKFERNRAILSGVIPISMFDPMTLNVALRVVLGSVIIFIKFDLWQLIRAWIIAFFDAG